MVLPDFLIRLLEILHLKDSDETKLKKQIAQCEENIRSLNQGLEKQIGDIRNLEGEFRELKGRYDASSGAVRETLAVRMRNILKDRERMGERRKLTEQQMNAEELVRHNLMLQLEYLQHPDNHDLEDIRDAKMDMMDDLKEQEKTIKQLEETTFDSARKDKDADFNKALDPNEDEFKDVDLTFSTPAPEPKKEAPEKKETPMEN